MTARSTTAILQLDESLQPPLYAKRGIALVRGEGVWLYDSDGQRYLDLMSNYGVNILGHAHPRVTAAIVGQASRLLSCHQSFASDVRAAFLEKLLAVAPHGLARAFLSNSGAEAVEAALKFAWAVTGRRKVVAAKRGYHGRTLGALAATGEPKYRQPFLAVLPEVVHVTYGDVAALESAVDTETAAVILEPVQGEAGIYPAPPEYLAAARRITRERGALLVFDEVQTAFRTGAWFACQHAGVSPDLLCVAKGLANGVPIGATLMTEDVALALPTGVHGSTFGGNPLACAAGLATLETLEDDGLIPMAGELGAYFRERLEALGHPLIREVRGIGLMLGLDLKTRATPVLKALQERGVLALPAGTTVVRILPPLVLTREDIDDAVLRIGEALDAVRAG
ncbi:aspartate aminotransferase family protein [Thermomicrobium sp. 4228-Ro]|uniref:aspartate aminotransferase family protein n=1 Tax=Thermomicrobium sp. 4228-Ro TaxID=2993937 RepID=UPI002248E761|nr:aspartate aminotransferase family protein [Thermomicrobium sp. 4228-Ro]MCX2726720.1 aspartate aminotransferase family protein [Thermomicrobium sp. 4228-Ro]